MQDKVQAITSPREESAQQSPPRKLEEAWVAPSPAPPAKVPDVPSPAALPGSSGLQPHTQQTLDSTSANKAVRPSDSEFRVVSLDGRDASASPPAPTHCDSEALKQQYAARQNDGQREERHRMLAQQMGMLQRTIAGTKVADSELEAAPGGKRSISGHFSEHDARTPDTSADAPPAWVSAMLNFQQQQQQQFKQMLDVLSNQHQPHYINQQQPFQQQQQLQHNFQQPQYPMPSPQQHTQQQQQQTQFLDSGLVPAYPYPSGLPPP